MTRIYTIEQGPVATETSRASNKLKMYRSILFIYSLKSEEK